MGFAVKQRACFNRRMRKTAGPVVWEGDGAQSLPLDLILYGTIHWLAGLPVLAFTM